MELIIPIPRLANADDICEAPLHTGPFGFWAFFGGAPIVYLEPDFQIGERIRVDNVWYIIVRVTPLEHKTSWYWRYEMKVVR